MIPSVAEIRADSADMITEAMAAPCPERTVLALIACDRLFARVRTPFEALLAPALAIWATVSGGTVRCQERLPGFGRVGFLLQHPRFRQALVIECDRVRGKTARDRALEAAGYAVCRLVLGDGKAGAVDALGRAFQDVNARVH
jgi:hypothetical protein